MRCFTQSSQHKTCTKLSLNISVKSRNVYLQSKVWNIAIFFHFHLNSFISLWHATPTPIPTCLDDRTCNFIWYPWFGLHSVVAAHSLIQLKCSRGSSVAGSSWCLVGLLRRLLLKCPSFYSSMCLSFNDSVAPTIYIPYRAWKWLYCYLLIHAKYGTWESHLTWHTSHLTWHWAAECKGWKLS